MGVAGVIGFNWVLLLFWVGICSDSAAKIYFFDVSKNSEQQ